MKTRCLIFTLALAAGTLLVAVPASAQSPAPSVAPPAAAPPAPQPCPADGPWGCPVPGHPGFVTSPYAPDAGWVDLRGFKSGDEVRCPYTGKLFLVR